VKSPFKNLSGVVVGLGSIGNRHLNNLLDLGVGKMTVVRRAGTQNTHFESPEGVEISHSLAKTLDAKPDFAVICNPSHLHAATAIECLEAGVHVLIEKPLGKTLGTDEKRLAELAAQTDRICAMAYSTRYHPAYQAAHEQIHDNKIGRCLYAKAWFEGYLPDWHPWEDYKTSYAGLKEQGGGVLRTLDHELDFLNWVLGPAESASGFAINSGGIGIEADDVAMYQLRHPEGAISQITSSFCRKPQSRGFEFVGSKGVLTFNMERGLLRSSSHIEDEPQTVKDWADYDVNEMYLDLAGDFLASIQSGESSGSLPLLNHGVRSLKLIEMINEEQICPN